MIRQESIDWRSFQKDLEASLENEKIWCKGSLLGVDREVHKSNIERIEEHLEDIKKGDYESVLNFYEEELFEDYMI